MCYNLQAMVAKLLKRHRRWIELALGFGVLVWLGWHILEREVVAEPGLLIDKFRVTVFSTDIGVFSTDIGPEKHKPAEIVHKWNGPVRLGLHGNAARYRDLVESIAGEHTRLTGLSVSVVDLEGPEPPNFHVHLAEPGEVYNLLIRYGENPEMASELAKRARCMAPTSHREGLIFDSVAVIENNFAEDLIRRCFIEEITHALGLFAHSELVQPSFFSSRGLILDELPLNDKILVRTLYDPRITPGMKREKVMEIAREIIPELVRAVRERGVEALYQR